MTIKLSLVDQPEPILENARIVTLENDNTSAVKKIVIAQFASDPTIKLLDLREIIKREVPGVSEAEIQAGFGDALRERNPNNPLFRGKEKGESLFENASEQSKNKCSTCGHSHDGDVCDDCECGIFTKTHENAKKLPTPLENESEETYVARFMVDPFASGEFPSDEARKEEAKKEFKAAKERKNAAGGEPNGCPDCGNHEYEEAGDDKRKCSKCGLVSRAKDWESRNMMLNAIGAINSSLVRERMNASFGEKWPKPVTIKFITPGMVRYEDLGNNGECDVLVRKAALDKMLNSLVGKPVVNENHRKVAPGDYNLGNADGIVSKVWYNATDAYYYCDVLVWDPETQRNMQNGYSASCAYTVKDWGEGGTHNNVPYDREVKDGEYTHMAIVASPRYEEAFIFNSLKGGCMKLMKLLFKDKDGHDSSADLDLKTPVELGNGLTPTLEELVNTFHLTEAAKAKVLDDSKMIDIGNGVQVKLSDLKANYLTNGLSAAHKDGKHKGSKVANCGMCNADDPGDEEETKRKKEEESKKDAKKAEDDEKKNALENARKAKEAADDKAAAERLENAAKARKGELPAPHFDSIEDGLSRGRDMFGFHEKLQPMSAAASK